MKQLCVLLFVLVGFILNSSFAYTILIDPGHGGEDQGAKGHYYIWNKKDKKKILIHEKDLTLSVSKKIYEELKKRYYDVYLSRSVDRTVSLQERADMAEKIKADLFISVHFNSSLSSKSNGVESSYLDNHKDAAIKKVEEVENANLSGGDLVVHQILIDLVIERTTKDSQNLGKLLHKKIAENGKRYGIRDRGLKPGLFYVLALSKRPGLLLEIGFLSNPKELKKLVSKKFQSRLAKSVAEGIDLYVKKFKKKNPKFF